MPKVQQVVAAVGEDYGFAFLFPASAFRDQLRAGVEASHFCLRRRAVGRQMPAARFDVRIERRDAAHVNQLKALCYGALRSGNPESPAASLHLPAATDQQADSGTIDGIQARDIHRQFACSLLNQAIDRILDSQERIPQTQAPGDLDHCDVRVHPSCFGFRDHERDLT